jgi:hypothetical protein
MGRILASLDEENGVVLVDLDELDVDPLAWSGRKVLADIIRTDWKLAMAAIHKHCELHARRTAELHERVDCGADRATGVEDVVDEHDRHPLDRERDARGPNNRLAIRRPPSVAHVHVVAVKRDVESTDGELHPASLLDQAPKPGCERHSARLDPDERDVLEPVTVGWPDPLDELVGDPRKGLGDASGVQKSLRRTARETAAQFLGIPKSLAIGDVRGQPSLLSGLTGPG